MQGTVYLEDVDPVREPSAPEDKNATSPAATPMTKGGSSSTVSSSTVSSATVTAVKRQRTLVDMFSGSQGKASSEPSAKKLKVSASTSSITSVSTLKSTGSVSRPKGFGVQKLNSIPFSLPTFQESLSTEEKEYLKLECEVMGKSWLKVLKDEIRKPYFISLKKFLQTEGVRGPNDTPKTVKVYPSPANIYAWSNTPLGKVKVVIIGQDPYHGRGQAHGLCFSVPTGVPVPPSLRNIYAELKAEYPEFEPPKHGNLTTWASNGVLMLNTCLTVRAGDAGSHSNRGWEEFTDRVVDVVDKYGGANLPTAGGSGSTGIGRGVVFLAWGAWAAKRVAKLGKGKHLILTSAHPSPFSAHRGFLGNGHFKTANEWLEAKYGSEGMVDWCALDGEVQKQI